MVARRPAALLRVVRPALLVASLHLGLLWVVTQYHGMPAALSLPATPPTVMLALIEPIQPTPPKQPAPPQPNPPRPVHAQVPVARPQRPAPVSSAAAVTASPVDTPAPAAAPVARPAAAEPAPAPIPSAPAQPPVITSGVQYISAPQPVYPAAARRRGDEGEVLLRVLINAEGGVEQVVLQRSSGIASLDQAAREAVTQARFRPYVEQGRAQPAYVVVPIRFQLTQ